MDTPELLKHPRYSRDPVFFFVEQLVIDTIEGIPEEMQSWIAKVTKADRAAWREKVKVVSNLSETFEVAVLDLWYWNSQIAMKRGERLAPQDFAQMFVDQYYKEGSEIDVWKPGALEAARARIALAQANERGNPQ